VGNSANSKVVVDFCWCDEVDQLPNFRSIVKPTATQQTAGAMMNRNVRRHLSTVLVKNGSRCVSKVGLFRCHDLV